MYRDPVVLSGPGASMTEAQVLQYAQWTTSDGQSDALVRTSHSTRYVSTVVWRLAVFFISSSFCLHSPYIIGVGAQSTLGGHDSLPEKYVWKINEMPEFYTIFARKIIKIPEIVWYFPKNQQNFRILHDFCPKMPEFCVIIARKILFQIFLGPPTAPRLLCLCHILQKQRWSFNFYAGWYVNKLTAKILYYCDCHVLYIPLIPPYA